MEYTELAGYSIPDGTLTVWTPDADTAAWRPDSRPLAPTHEEHCRNADPHAARPGRGCWIGSAFTVDRPYSPEAVRTLVRTWFARHEGLRTTVHRDPATGALRRSTVLGEHVDALAIAVPGATTGGQITTVLVEHFESVLSPLAWPHCVVATVEHADGDGFTVVFGADHSVMDAYSQLVAITELRGMYQRIYDGAPADDGKDYGSYVDYSDAERQAGAALTADSAPVREWGQFLDAGAFPHFLPARPRAPRPLQPRKQASLSQWLLTPAQAEAFNTACRALGHSSQAGVLAAMALAQARLTGDLTFRTILPVHTRAKQCWAESMGWFVNIVPVTVTLAHADDTAGALASATAAITAAKPLGAAPFARVAQLLGLTQAPKFVVSYVDTRFLPGADIMEEINGRALRSDSYAEGEVYFWVNRTPRGLNVSSRFPSDRASTAAVRAFLAAFTAILTSAGATATKAA